MPYVTMRILEPRMNISKFYHGMCIAISIGNTEPSQIVGGLDF